jgi:hypothetical protein
MVPAAPQVGPPVVVRADPEVWSKIHDHLEALVPWILTAVIEFAATAKNSEPGVIGPDPEMDLTRRG